MSCTVSISVTVSLPLDESRVTYDGQDVNVWPAGVGVGPVMQLSWLEWQALVMDAKRAYDQYHASS